MKIADLAGSDNMIRGREFEGCLITGPAVLVHVSGGLTIEGCKFPGPIENFVWPFPAGRTLFGPVGLDGCSFRDCTFEDTVGFAADPATIEAFIADLLR